MASLDKFGFAIDDSSQLIHINDAIGLADQKIKSKYFCVNPECEGEMIIVRGKVKISHFRHKVAVCSVESYEHHLAKALIVKNITEQSPIDLVFNCQICDEPKLNQRFPKTIRTAIPEYPYPDSNFRGDVGCFKDDGSFACMFEVFVTHRVDSIKSSKIKSWIEVSASDVISSNYSNSNSHKWKSLSSSPLKKPMICVECTKDSKNFAYPISRLKLLDKYAHYHNKTANLYKSLDSNYVDLLCSDMAVLCHQIEKAKTPDHIIRVSNDKLTDAVKILYRLVKNEHFVAYFFNESELANTVLSNIGQYINPKFLNQLWKERFQGNIKNPIWEKKVRAYIARIYVRSLQKYVPDI